MPTLTTRYIAVFAVFMHSLLCGNVFCCAMTGSGHDDVVLVSHDLPPASCPCNSEKQDMDTEGNNSGGNESGHDCGHQYHFCQCVQSPPPNTETDVRVVLIQNQLSQPIATHSATPFDLAQETGLHVPETACATSASEVRLHLLLEHFLL